MALNPSNRLSSNLEQLGLKGLSVLFAELLHVLIIRTHVSGSYCVAYICTVYSEVIKNKGLANANRPCDCSVLCYRGRFPVRHN